MEDDRKGLFSSSKLALLSVPGAALKRAPRRENPDLNTMTLHDKASEAYGLTTESWESKVLVKGTGLGARWSLHSAPRGEKTSVLVPRPASH